MVQGGEVKSNNWKRNKNDLSHFVTVVIPSSSESHTIHMYMFHRSKKQVWNLEIERNCNTMIYTLMSRTTSRIKYVI